MANLFFLFFDQSSTPRQQVLQFLEDRPEIIDYHAAIPSNLVVIITSCEISALRDLMNSAGGMRFFLLVETKPERVAKEIDGYLPKATWEFIQSSEHEIAGAPISAPKIFAPSQSA